MTKRWKALPERAPLRRECKGLPCGGFSLFVEVQNVLKGRSVKLGLVKRKFQGFPGTRDDSCEPKDILILFSLYQRI